MVAVRSIREDIGKLRDLTQHCRSTLERFSRIFARDGTIRINRPILDAIISAVDQDSGHCLIIGEPGAGKSGILHDLVERLAGGWDVVCVTSTSVAASTIGELRHDLGLEHDLFKILHEWNEKKPGIVIVDALDAIRGTEASQTWKEIIRQIIREKTRWRVVATIRKYDLRCGSEWQELFAGQPPLSHYQDHEFRDVRHVNVSAFSDEELAQLPSQSTELGNLLRMVRDEPLFELLRQPFNLHLSSRLLSDGIGVEELSPLRTQLELLDRYWSKRVGGKDAARLGRENAIKTICKWMVQYCKMQISTSSGTQLVMSDFLDQLLRSGS